MSDQPNIIADETPIISNKDVIKGLAIGLNGGKVYQILWERDTGPTFSTKEKAESFVEKIYEEYSWYSPGDPEPDFPYIKEIVLDSTEG